MDTNNKHFTDKKGNRIIGTAHTHRVDSPPSGLGGDEVPTDQYDVSLIQRTQAPAYVLGPKKTFVGTAGGGSSLSPTYRVSASLVKSPNLLMDLLTKSK